MTPLRTALAGPLAGFTAYKQFILYVTRPSPSRPGKTDKLPVDVSGTVVSAHDSKHWMSADQALTTADLLGYGVGFVFTERDPFWFLDMDGALSGGAWTPLALSMFQALSGCAAEISGSGTGAHIFGSGTIPPHGCRNQALGLELYHSGRFVALTGTAALGDCRADASAVLPALIAQYFPATTKSDKDWWSDGPIPEWHGPTSDEELIRRAMRPSANSAFSDKASFADLWTANEVALAKSYPDADGRPYDCSFADAALAQHLAFWTGNDCERMDRLMRQSALYRNKYEREDYLPRTIRLAAGRQESVLGDNLPATTPASLTVPSGSPAELTPEDFWAHLPSHKYINRFTRESYSVDAINGHLRRFTDQLGMKPALWLDQFRAVQQMSWNPGQGEIIEGMTSDSGNLRPDPKGRIFNRFRPSDAVSSDADPSTWVDHVRRIYPTDAEHIIQWIAYRIQHPGDKINHALVIGGIQGTGKDFMLEPLRYGVGPSNVETVKPTELFSNFTDWVERTVLIINEARDLGDENRYSFYETTKPLIAGPPDTLRCNMKSLIPYSVPNVMAVVITTNNKLSGLYLPPDDRRHYIAWSPADRPSDDYFREVWAWMENGGKQAVLGYLQRLDISKFNAKADPPKTEAWKQIVTASVNPEDMSLGDAIEGIQIATVKEIIAALQFKGHIELAMSLQKNTRKIPHILERIGLEVLPNPNEKTDGRWRLGDGRKETIYVDRKLSISERLRLAQEKLAR